MKAGMLSVVFFLLSFPILCQAVIVHSPESIPDKANQTKIFLGGSIDMGNAENWQAKVEQMLAKKNVVLLNPRRDDWNKDWKPVSTDTNFRKQVEWELNALEKADIIIMYFAPQSQSPVSLLELGLYAKSGKLMVVCPEGYWRKGNVDIVCEKYGVKMYPNIESLIEDLKSSY